MFDKAAPWISAAPAAAWLVRSGVARLGHVLDPYPSFCFNALQIKPSISKKCKPKPMQQKSIWQITANLVLSISMLVLSVTHANAAETPNTVEPYKIQPGDVLSISVWKEEELSLDIIVRPDGQISVPLAGEISAAGDSVENLRMQISAKLEKYIADPVLTVSVRSLSGNKIFVIGKVNRPGQFSIVRNIDVMQALSMAGGTSTYAALNDIKILRRENGKLSAMSFKYGEVEKGKRLEQNILLKAGDVVVVP